MAHATVEQAGPHEARRLARIVQPLHSVEPGTLVAWRDGIGGVRRVGDGGACADEHASFTGAGHAVQVDGGLEGNAESTQEVDQVVTGACRADDDDHLRIGAGGEGGERVRQSDVRLQRGRRRSLREAIRRRHQLTADDDDTGSLPLVQCLCNVAAGGQRAR